MLLAGTLALAGWRRREKNERLKVRSKLHRLNLQPRPRPTGARRSNKLLPSLGILLVTGGILLLLWFAWLWFNPGPAPYRYQLVEEGGVDKFSQLGLAAWPDLKLAQYEVYAEGVDQPLAVTHTARQADGPTRPAGLGKPHQRTAAHHSTANSVN